MYIFTRICCFMSTLGLVDLRNFWDYVHYRFPQCHSSIFIDNHMIILLPARDSCAPRLWQFQVSCITLKSMISHDSSSWRLLFGARRYVCIKHRWYPSNDRCIDAVIRISRKRLNRLDLSRFPLTLPSLTLPLPKEILAEFLLARPWP